MTATVLTLDALRARALDRARAERPIVVAVTPTLYAVPSRDTHPGGWWSVPVADPWACECPAGRHRSACTHAAAVVLVLRGELPLYALPTSAAAPVAHPAPRPRDPWAEELCGPCARNEHGDCAVSVPHPAGTAGRWFCQCECLVPEPDEQD